MRLAVLSSWGGGRHIHASDFLGPMQSVLVDVGPSGKVQTLGLHQRPYIPLRKQL